MINKAFLCINALVLLIFVGCNLEPIYKTKFTEDLLCSIKVVKPQSHLNLYEVGFQNLLEMKLCMSSKPNKSLLLTWNIIKTNTGLITAKNAAESRYEVVLTAKFHLTNIDDNKTIYSGEIYAKAAHNVLEDELFSTITAERNAENMAAKNLVDNLFDKVYLFMIKNKNENS
tara:strand:- start:211 stop:726 length:516 start_codon:yes stop_codon:yes gene_type:complete